LHADKKEMANTLEENKEVIEKLSNNLKEIESLW